MTATQTEPTTFTVMYREGPRRPWKPIAEGLTEDAAYRVLRTHPQGGDFWVTPSANAAEVKR